METKHSFYTGTSEKMDAISSQSVELIVTSPPYPMIEMWDKQFFEWDPEIGTLLQEQPPAPFRGGAAWERMHQCLDRVWQECDRVLKTHSFICINIGDAVRTLRGRFRLYPNHARIIQRFESLGYDILPLILWRKSTNAPNKFMGSGMLPAGAYVTLEHEYILVFRKGPKRTFSSPEEKQRRRESALFWEERNVWYSDVWQLGGASQVLDPNSPADTAGKKLRERSGAFPWELAYRLINMYSLRGDIILDPFGGTGSTALAAAASCRKSVSYEYEKQLNDLAFNRLLQGKKLINRRVQERIASHLRFIDSHQGAGHDFRHRNTEYDFSVKTAQEKDIRMYEIESITHARDTILHAGYRPVKPEARQKLLDF
jgi:modification methylase